MRAAFDIVTGELSTWQEYLGAAVSGAVTAEVSYYLGPVAGGSAGAFAGNIATQLSNNNSQTPLNFDFMSLAVDTALGAAAGGLKGPKLSGVNSGRNSYTAICNQIKTKISNGTISSSSISAKTAVKMFIGQAWDKAYIQGSVLTFGASGLYGKFLGDAPEDTSREKPLQGVPSSMEEIGDGLGQAQEAPHNSPGYSF